MGLTTVHKIIQETNKALWEVLSPLSLKTSSTEGEWKKISTGFYETWNFPNYIGAMDEKHIAIKAPAHSGSLYFNYKKTFSIVLLVTCDWNYVFTMVDIGAYGSQNDGDVFKNSIFSIHSENNNMSIPNPSAIPFTNINMPYVLVANEGSPLKDYIMRPYLGKKLSPTQ